jgi:hypothetical protein
VQWAALALLRATSLQPLEETTALQAASESGDEAAAEALRHLISIQLVRKPEAMTDALWCSIQTFGPAVTTN